LTRPFKPRGDRAETSNVSSHGETARTKIGDTLGRPRARRGAHVNYRDALAAHLVMSLADLRLKRRAQERARRQASSSA
jgi:hypothetical protein